jgi:hypothetical protein
MPRYVKGQRQPGQGGRRNPPGGRPTKAQVAERESLRQAIERKREELSGVLADRYVTMAQEDPATMRHLVDKVMPDEEKPTQPLQITFLQFTHKNEIEIDRNLSSRAQRIASVPAERQGQNGLEFHDFSSGNGQRRRLSKRATDIPCSSVSGHR